MSPSILVAYITRYGSTAEVAEEIAITLGQQRFDVDCRPAGEVHTLEGYRAVVLGAPLYIGSWSREAHTFLSHFEDALESRPIAIFALGPLTTDDEESRNSRHLLDSHIERHDWLYPLAVGMFGGKYDPAGLSLRHKLIAALPGTPLHGRPASDGRDWTSIHEWAKELAIKLQTKLVPTEA